MTVEQQVARRRSRRDEILEIAVGLFASRGYHGVSMDDIGAAAGVTGPALYHHFAGKEAMLAAALIPVSEQLLAGGRAPIAEYADQPPAALAAPGRTAAHRHARCAVVLLVVHRRPQSYPQGEERDRVAAGGQPRGDRAAGHPYRPAAGRPHDRGALRCGRGPAVRARGGRGGA